jgi:hypothetical protein
MQKQLLKRRTLPEFKVIPIPAPEKTSVKSSDGILHDLPSCPALEIPYKVGAVSNSTFHSVHRLAMIDASIRFLQLTVINEKLVRRRPTPP